MVVAWWGQKSKDGIIDLNPLLKAFGYSFYNIFVQKHTFSYKSITITTSVTILMWLNEVSQHVFCTSMHFKFIVYSW